MASYTIGPEDVCLWYSDTHLRLPEFRKTLQRQDFPRATRSLLEWLHRYFVQCENFPPGKFPNQDCVRQLIEEFVFYRNSGTSRVQQKLTAIQELRLLEELCNHFQLNRDLITRHNVFDAFFGCKPGPITPADEHRTAALSKLVSMAIAVNCIPVLDCTAVLLHNQGTSQATLALTRSLVEDYCTLIPTAGDLLKDLVDSSPQFVSRLLSSIAALYDVDRDPKKTCLPPTSLLEVLSSWTSKYPLICVEHVLHPLPGIPSFHSTSSASSPALSGPFPGLIKACVLSPLVGPGNAPSPTDAGNAKANGSPAQLLYSRLHLGILQALLSTQHKLKSRLAKSKHEELLSERDVEGVAASLRRRLLVVVGGAGQRREAGDAAADVALDRLAQVVQVALSTGTLHSTRNALKTTLGGLPDNQLLSLVLHHEGAMQS